MNISFCEIINNKQGAFYSGLTRAEFDEKFKDFDIKLLQGLKKNKQYMVIGNMNKVVELIYDHETDTWLFDSE